jgi:hypothetical protein
VEQRMKLFDCCVTFLEQRNLSVRARQFASYTPLCSELHASSKSSLKALYQWCRSSLSVLRLVVYLALSHP